MKFFLVTYSTLKKAFFVTKYMYYCQLHESNFKHGQTAFYMKQKRSNNYFKVSDYCIIGAFEVNPNKISKIQNTGVTFFEKLKVFLR